MNAMSAQIRLPTTPKEACDTLRNDWGEWVSASEVYGFPGKGTLQGVGNWRVIRFWPVAPPWLRGCARCEIFPSNSGGFAVGV